MIWASGLGYGQVYLSPTLFCQKEARSGVPRSWQTASIEVDSGYKVLSSTVRIGMPGPPQWVAEWDVITGSNRPVPKLRNIKISAWSLPRNTLFPVTVTVQIDGLPAASQTFNGPTPTIYDLVNDPKRQPSDPEWPLTIGSPAVDLRETLPLVTLWRAARVVLTTLDRNGNRVDGRALALPDWQALTAFTDEAFPELEKQRAARGCSPTARVVVS